LEPHEEIRYRFETGAERKTGNALNVEIGAEIAFLPSMVVGPRLRRPCGSSENPSTKTTETEMKYRWKLLILLLAMSILPVIGLRTFGIHNVRMMAGAITQQVEINQAANVHSRLRLLSRSYREVIGRYREQIEMALLLQAFALRQILDASGQPVESTWPAPSRDPGPVPSAADRLPGRHCVTAGSGDEGRTSARTALPMEQMQPVYRTIARHLGDIALRHYSGVENGAVSVFPCPEDMPVTADLHDSPWYRTAFSEKLSLWSRPFRDPATDRPVMAVSMPLEDANEQITAVTSILVPLESLLGLALPLSDLPDETAAFLTTLAVEPDGRSVGAEILVQALHETGPVEAESPIHQRWLASADRAQFLHMIDDFARRTTGIRRMPYRQKDCFWIYGPLPHQGTAFVFIIPAERVLRPSHRVMDAIAERVDQVEFLTAGFLILLILINSALALGFSMTVTRPLRALVAASRRLAGGDFKTRVNIPSRDEFGDLGRVFNQVGPRLESHVKLQQALDVAMQIQYNLLPQASPAIDGLDVKGMAFYSEEIGGDYFDYLCVGDQGRRRLCVTVGDVSDHGIPSAMLMATARALIRQRVAVPDSLGEIVTDVNRRFSEDVEGSGRFMTLFLARIDREGERIEWVRAGHDPALLYDPRSDTFSQLEEGKGLPLGVDADIPYRAASLAIEPGQIVCIGTDGIWETRNETGEFFGKTRLQQVIRQYSAQDARTILLSIFDAVEEFRGHREQHDDLTLVIVKVTN
jgi:sigma-B regulation protein RsbU (phosphoserine phosphatase)